MPRRPRRTKQYTPTIDAELDLHGYTRSEAREAVLRFLEDADRNHWSRVRIVVGKGTRSAGGVPVLPTLVKAILGTLSLDYTYAKPEHGGEGAIDVRVPE